MKVGLFFQISRNQIALPVNIEWEKEKYHHYKREADCDNCKLKHILNNKCEPCMEKDGTEISIYFYMLIFKITLHIVIVKDHKKEKTK